MKLTPQQRRDLIAEAQCAAATLNRWLDKRPMKPTVKARLDAAWKRMRNGHSRHLGAEKTGAQGRRR